MDFAEGVVPRGESLTLDLAVVGRAVSGFVVESDDADSLLLTRVEFDGEPLNIGSNGAPAALFKRRRRQFAQSMHRTADRVQVTFRNIDMAADHKVSVQLTVCDDAVETKPTPVPRASTPEPDARRDLFVMGFGDGARAVSARDSRLDYVRGYEQGQAAREEAVAAYCKANNLPPPVLR